VSCRLHIALALGLFVVSASSTGAQTPELRADVIAGDRTVVHAGAGLTFALGTYLRSGLVGGLGASSEGISGRIDLVNRFHLDPFRESRWGPYAGGGLSVRFEDNAESRTYLLLLLGVDGPAKRGLTTSFEAGFGGGARIGVAIRRAAERR